MNKKNIISKLILLLVIALLPALVLAEGDGHVRILCKEYELNPNQETECHIVAEMSEGNTVLLTHTEIATHVEGKENGTNGLIFKRDKIGTIFENTQAFRTEKGAEFNSTIMTAFTNNGGLADDVLAICPDNSTVTEEGCYEFLYPDGLPITPKVTEKPGTANQDFANTVSLGYVTIAIDEDTVNDSDCANLCVNAYVYEKKDGKYVKTTMAGDCAELKLTTPKVCVIVVENDEKKYYGKEGKEVTEEKYREECPVCRIVNDKYYDHDGNETTAEEWAKNCLCRIQNGKYYDSTGNPVTEEEYKKACGCRIDTTAGKYYDNNGNEVTEEEYKKACVPETGSFASYAVLAAGALIALSAITIAKKHNRFYRV